MTPPTANTLPKLAVQETPDKTPLGNVLHDVDILTDETTKALAGLRETLHRIEDRLQLSTHDIKHEIEEFVETSKMVREEVHKLTDTANRLYRYEDMQLKRARAPSLVGTIAKEETK